MTEIDLFGEPIKAPRVQPRPSREIEFFLRIYGRPIMDALALIQQAQEMIQINDPAQAGTMARRVSHLLGEVGREADSKTRTREQIFLEIIRIFPPERRTNFQELYTYDEGCIGEIVHRMQVSREDAITALNRYHEPPKKPQITSEDEDEGEVLDAVPVLELESGTTD